MRRIGVGSLQYAPTTPFCKMRRNLTCNMRRFQAANAGCKMRRNLTCNMRRFSAIAHEILNFPLSNL